MISSLYIKYAGIYHDMEIESSVSDPYNFNTNSDPRIRFVEKRILLRIRLSIEKIPTLSITLYLLITQKWFLMLFYEAIIL